MLGHYTAANGPLAWLSYYTTLLSGAGVAVFHDLMSFPSLETLLRRANYRRRIIVECFFFFATWPARYPVAHFLLVRGRGASPGLDRTGRWGVGALSVYIGILYPFVCVFGRNLLDITTESCHSHELLFCLPLAKDGMAKGLTVEDGRGTSRARRDDWAQDLILNIEAKSVITNSDS